jgi:hypothetical protein
MIDGPSSIRTLTFLLLAWLEHCSLLSSGLWAVASLRRVYVIKGQELYAEEEDDPA